MREIHRVEKIPVNGSLLYESKLDAIGCMHREIVLACCQACGFIQNDSFDSGVRIDSIDRDECQGNLSVSNSMDTEIARDWVMRYGLIEKRVMEVGCENGEFLEILCRMGNNYGIGVGPWAGVGVTKERKRGNIAFIAEEFSEDHARFRVDFICARHEFQKTMDVKGVVKSLRASLSGGQRVIVAIEIPDAERVMNRSLFWEINYEYCSYFTAMAIQILLKSSGFTVIREHKAYGGRHVIVEARPSSRLGRMVRSATRSEAISDGVINYYRTGMAGAVERWAKRIAGWSSSKRRIAIWGADSRAVSFMATLGCRDAIERVVDADSSRHGLFVPHGGHRVASPEELLLLHPDVVIATSSLIRDQITDSINALGLKPELIFL